MPAAARSSSRASAASPGGTATPVPPQPGPSPLIPGRPAAGMASPARPAGVSRTGRARSTTPRLRSSLHTAATIGTGRSASPPAEATSATTTSTSLWRSLAPGHHGGSRSPRAAAGSTVSSHIMPAKASGSLPGGGRPLLRPARARHDADPAAEARPGRPLAAGTQGKLLYTVDAALTPDSPVTDIGELTALASDAVAAGGGHVLDASHVMFPNGAVTLVLILAESHLAIHTWPEDNLIAIDLFSCGAIDGHRVAAELARLLGLDQVHMRQIERGTVRPGR